MKHVPHLVIAAPWQGPSIPVSVLQWRHLTKVLKVSRGDKVTYTDGLGTIGSGRLGGQVVERGEEDKLDRGRRVTLAVAPPASKDRQRFVVEKLAELGVARLIWLRTRHGKNRPVSPAKSFAWAVAALEQSRGAWLLEIDEEPTAISELEPPLLVCHPGGSSQPGESTNTVVVGPEGGFADDEIPDGAGVWDLGPTILRVETAAVVAAARILST